MNPEDFRKLILAQRAEYAAAEQQGNQMAKQGQMFAAVNHGSVLACDQLLQSLGLSLVTKQAVPVEPADPADETAKPTE